MNDIDKQNKIRNNLVCLECNVSFQTQLKLSKHIKLHGLTSKDYYDKFYKTNGEGICKTCGSST